MGRYRITAIRILALDIRCLHRLSWHRSASLKRLEWHIHPTTSGRWRRTSCGDGRHQGLRLGSCLPAVGPAIGLLLLIVVLTQLSPVFLTPRNIGNLLAQSAVICVLAMGQLLVIVTRGIDLSVGSTLALGTVVGALAFAAGRSAPVVVAAMLLTGAVVGVVNGVVFV